MFSLSEQFRANFRLNCVSPTNYDFKASSDVYRRAYNVIHEIIRIFGKRNFNEYIIRAMPQFSRYT